MSCVPVCHDMDLPNIYTKTYSKIMTIDDREAFCLFSFILAKISSEQTESLIIHSCLILTSSKCHLNYYINVYT